MTEKAKPGEGDVEITLAGEKKVLRPTLRAIRDVSRMCDGIGGAISRVQKVDFDTICSVIALGLDLTERGTEGLEEKVYETGVVTLAAPVTRYLVILSNGGRAKAPEAAKTGTHPPA